MADLRELLQSGLADRYRIERELGRGGMATVFLAHDLRHKRPVALKVLHAELAHTLGPERFQREIETVARLQHPHILTVHDSGTTAGQLWFTMPFVEGESLRDRLRREQQLPVEVALRIATDAARALQYAHDHGVIHRDIKPENLLLTKDGSTLVADFGIARALSADDDRLTETGLSVGTPTYMSPEQAAGDRHLDARADVYSLATVFYEMLVGEPPFTGATARSVIAKRLSGEVPRVRHVRPSVPESVEQAVIRALALVPADRFASANEFARALEPTLATPAAAPTMPPGSTVRADGGRASARAWRRVPLVAMALGLGVIIGLGVLFAWRRSHSGAAETGGAKVLAVLPFENLGDSADAYFADGLANDLRSKLSRVAGLAVIARGSSNDYQGTTKTQQQIARELRVDYLLTATVQWEKAAGGASRVRVTPELVEVRPEHAPQTRWGQSFDAELTGVFQVQADIAGRVADALDVALGTTQKQILTERPTASLVAYQAFLRGEAASQSLGVADPASLRRAIGFYEQAVALDSTYVEAWALLGRAHAAVYFAGTPTPAGAEASKRAAERAVALGPGRPEGQLALGDYQAFVGKDNAQALVAYQAGLKAAPADADLLTSSARAEQSLGRWDAALEYLARARALDPRGVSTARRLAVTLLWLRRYPAALAASARALALAPANLDLVENKVMVSLALGDLAGARAVLRAVPAEVEPTALVAWVGYNWELMWVLDDAQQQLLLRLPPSAFDHNRANWGIVLAQTYHLREDAAKARAYADSARLGLEQQLGAIPEDAERQVLLGLALAYIGRPATAVREGERAIRLLPVSKNAYIGPWVQHQLARIYILVGEPEKALDLLEPLLRIPYYLSPGWLKIDPTFDPLRGNPRFERLVNGK